MIYLSQWSFELNDLLNSMIYWSRWSIDQRYCLNNTVLHSSKSYYCCYNSWGSALAVLSSARQWTRKVPLSLTREEGAIFFHVGTSVASNVAFHPSALVQSSSSFACSKCSGSPPQILVASFAELKQEKYKEELPHCVSILPWLRVALEFFFRSE